MYNLKVDMFPNKLYFLARFVICHKCPNIKKFYKDTRIINVKYMYFNYYKNTSILEKHLHF